MSVIFKIRTLFSEFISLRTTCVKGQYHFIIARYSIDSKSQKMSETPAKMRNEAPDIGQNNEEIFLEIGLSKSDLKNLEEQGVI